MPTLAADAHQFTGLLAIADTDSEYIALTAAGNFTVDWGDGSAAEDVTANTRAEHKYTFESVSSALTAEGWKQVLVTVTPQSGQTFSKIDLQQKYSRAGLGSVTAPWLDIALNGPSLTTITFGGTTVYLRYLEHVNDGVIGAVTSFSNAFSYCYSLQTAPAWNTASGTNFSYAFTSCYSLQTAPAWNTASGTNFSGAFQNCYSLQAAPAWNTASGTSFSSAFYNCYSLSRSLLTGATIAHSYAGCKLARAQIVEIFNNLGTASGTQAITLTGNHGVADLTAEDLLIATNKGWTVTTA